MANKVFRCAIQATVSTLTGCMAKMIAARKAPGILSFPTVHQMSSAEAMWISRFVT